MRVFRLEQLSADNEARNQPWLEFLRTASLSMGLYQLKAGQVDQQRPHTEDEVYFVISGKAWFRSDEQTLAVGPGTLIFVERTVEHRFFDILEDLTVLVFFAPPEDSCRDDRM